MEKPILATTPIPVHRENDQQKHPYKVVVKYLVPVLLSTIAIKYQGKGVDPFETHPTSMWIFFSSICIYYWFMGVMNAVNDYPGSFYHELKTITGILSCVALASVLLPRVIGWVLFAVWALFATFISRHFLVFIYGLIIPSHIREWINNKSMSIMQWFQSHSILPK